MTVKNVISKLSKLGISYTIIDHNGYNKDLKFSINGMNFAVGYVEGKNEAQDFCREICWNESEQETQRSFYPTFSKLLKRAQAI